MNSTRQRTLRIPISAAVEASVSNDPRVTMVADQILDTMPRVTRKIRAAMRADGLGHTTLTVPQLRALLYVRRHPGRNLSALGDHLGISPSGGSALVERLVKADLVERTVDPAERRSVQLRLTPTGAEQVAMAELRAKSWLMRILAELDPVDLGHLETNLRLLDRVATAKERRQ